MSDETFTSGGNSHKITMYPAPADGKKHANADVDSRKKATEWILKHLPPTN